MNQMEKKDTKKNKNENKKKKKNNKNSYNELTGKYSISQCPKHILSQPQKQILTELS